MQNYRISLRFSRLSDADLNGFTTSVITGMTDNPAFPAPLVPLSELKVLQKDFADALAASSEGGPRTTAIKNDCRAALMSALRRQASYVQGITRHDLPLLLSSGFNAASQNRAQTPLASPAILQILNEYTERLTLRLTPVANARSYQIHTRVGEGEWQDAGIFPQARRIEVKDLKPGTVYQLRARALGGSTGYSDWSDATSRMSL
jgi:hypothetical protein